MIKQAVRLAISLGALGVASHAMAADQCPRSELQSVVNRYIAAQEQGDPASLPLAQPFTYEENRQPAVLKTGILSTPQKIDFHRSLLDTKNCESFTEVIITDPKHPYVLGTNIAVSNGKISAIRTLVTDKGDWLFSPANDLKYSPKEDWGVLPPAERSSRAALVAAANAYFDYFSDKNVKVPWGKPCDRLEGGLRTGKGRPDDSCDVGVPKNIHIIDRHFVVDPEHGAVVALVSFGPTHLPDSHMFRVVNGKIRYIHTITVCSTFNCGLAMPKQLLAGPQ